MNNLRKRLQFWIKENESVHPFWNSVFGFLSQFASLLTRLNVEMEELLAGLVEGDLDRGQARQALGSSLLLEQDAGAACWRVFKHGRTRGGRRPRRSWKRSNCIPRLNLHVNIGRLAGGLQPQGGWGVVGGSHNHHVGKLVGALLAGNWLHFCARCLTTATRFVIGVEHILTRAGLQMRKSWRSLMDRIGW